MKIQAKLLRFSAENIFSVVAEIDCVSMNEVVPKDWHIIDFKRGF